MDVDTFCCILLSVSIPHFFTRLQTVLSKSNRARRIVAWRATGSYRGAELVPSFRQSSAHMSELLIHLVNSLAVLLRRYLLVWIQKAVMDDTAYRPPNSYRNLLSMKCGIWKVLWSLFVVQPLSRTSSIIVEDPSLITCHSLIKTWVVNIVQRKHRRHLKMETFSNFAQFVMDLFVKRFWVPYLSQVAGNVHERYIQFCSMPLNSFA